MKLALLKGNRFNPWHLEGFARLPDMEVVGFRADSEIQKHFDARGADNLPFPIEPIFFDTQAGPAWLRVPRVLAERYRGRVPRIVPAQ